MSAATKQRFEWLVTLNLEGISSTEEDYELWQLVSSRSGFREEFIETRHMHYLLKARLDAAASQKRFANRIMNALHPDRLSDTAFTTAVLQRLREKTPKESAHDSPMAVWKIAASIIIVLGCLAVLMQYTFQPDHRRGVPGRETAQYLDWNYQSAIPQLEMKMAAIYRHAGTLAGWTPQLPGPVAHRIKQMNAQMIRMEKRWPLSVERLNDRKNGEPL